MPGEACSTASTDTRHNITTYNALDVSNHLNHRRIRLPRPVNTSSTADHSYTRRGYITKYGFRYLPPTDRRWPGLLLPLWLQQSASQAVCVYVKSRQSDVTRVALAVGPAAGGRL